jgi:hypothetical protein
LDPGCCNAAPAGGAGGGAGVADAAGCFKAAKSWKQVVSGKTEKLSWKDKPVELCGPVLVDRQGAIVSSQCSIH